jgi:hypothetical protein
MSPSLPDRPNLDHLKKQAKDRLQELQATSPGAQLANAQHALARDYGFASWPKLKAHVEAQEQVLSPPPPAPPPVSSLSGSFGRYSHRARQALFFARFEAAQLGSPNIESEHLLLGVLRARHGIDVPASMALPLNDLRTEIEGRAASAEPLPTSVVIPFSDPTRQSLQRAVDEADRRHHQQVGTMHLLLGMLADPSLTATSVLSMWRVGYSGLADDPAAFTGE